MTEFVRVRLENGSEASVSAEFAKLHDLKPLSKPAASSGGALPAKFDPLKPAASAAAEPAKEEK